MKLFIRVKFRANLYFTRVDIGTVEQEIDLGPVILALIKHVLPANLRADADLAPLNFGPLPQPLKVWDKNGVYVEVR